MIAQFLSFLNKKMAYRQTYTTDKTVAYNRQRYEISGQRMSLWNPKLWTPNKKIMYLNFTHNWSETKQTTEKYKLKEDPILIILIVMGLHTATKKLTINIQKIGFSFRC